MDIISIPNTNHYLNGKWNLYYHLPNDKNWDLDSYKLIMNDIQCAEEVIALNAEISEIIVKYSMIFIMRKGIVPQWEDPKNRNGGAFSFKVINKQIYDVWKIIFTALCGETLFVDNEINKSVNGISISPKKNFCILKIWLNTCEYKDPNQIINIPNLQKQGCIFKKHEPEF